jgi:hypothetical protein
MHNHQYFNQQQPTSSYQPRQYYNQQSKYNPNRNQNYHNSNPIHRSKTSPRHNHTKTRSNPITHSQSTTESQMTKPDHESPFYLDSGSSTGPLSSSSSMNNDTSISSTDTSGVEDNEECLLEINRGPVEFSLDSGNCCETDADKTSVDNQQTAVEQYFSENRMPTSYSQHHQQNRRIRSNNSQSSSSTYTNYNRNTNSNNNNRYNSQQAQHPNRTYRNSQDQQQEATKTYASITSNRSGIFLN